MAPCGLAALFIPAFAVPPYMWDGAPSMIEVRNLSFQYPAAARPAIEGVDFSVARGEILGFLGPSGAGKSTTQKILTGLLPGYSGSVQVLGREARHWKRSDYARIGVSFELPNHYLKLTARENLAFFRALYPDVKSDPLELLEEVGLAADADKRVSELSKGMRTRLNLARALLHGPELLFLDEPTAGLDPATSRQIRDLIRSRREAGATVFLTTHDMHAAEEMCDRVAFLAGGTLRAVDAPRSLRLRYGRRLVRVELRRDGIIEKREFPLEGLGENSGFLATLREGEVETIHSQETTLEEIFITVTGTTLQ
jgi:fluoroquinolone transport system ATP-binding protein